MIAEPEGDHFSCRRFGLSVVKGCLLLDEHVMVPEVYRKRILKQLFKVHRAYEVYCALLHVLIQNRGSQTSW